MTELVILESLLGLLRFFFGACIFSFLGVVADRLPRGEGIVKGRSHCTACGRILSAAELIPCISYLALRGHCKGCGERIPRRALLGEILGGLSFLLCALQFTNGNTELISLQGAVIFCYLGILWVVALIDWDTRLIYNRFHLIIAALGLIELFLAPAHGLTDRLIGAVIVSLPMLLLAIAVPGAFGGGDIKLMAASGFFLGIDAIVVGMFFGLLSGGLYASCMLASKKLKRGDQFAFGPFLAFGLGIAALWGDPIAEWYLRML